jgi:hypothetical protein
MVLLPEQIKAEVQTNGTGQGGNDQQTLCFKMTQVSEPSHPDKFLPDHMLQCRNCAEAECRKQWAGHSAEGTVGSLFSRFIGHERVIKTISAKMFIS